MRLLIFIILLCGFSCPVWAVPPPQTYRKTLTQPAEIQGYSCAKGYTWFYANGHLKSCSVARNTDFGVARAPAGSWITLDADGKPRILQLVRDTQIAGYNCMGGNRLLGPREGAETGFYSSGKLKNAGLRRIGMCREFRACDRECSPATAAFSSSKAASCVAASCRGTTESCDAENVSSRRSEGRSGDCCSRRAERQLPAGEI